MEPGEHGLLTPQHLADLSDRAQEMLATLRRWEEEKAEGQPDESADAVI